jgi:hypothetical protein
LPSGILKDLAPIIYITEAIIFILGLVLINGVGLGRSDLGVWLMGGFGIFLVLLGLLFYFGSGFVPYAYHAYNALFGILIGILGLFALFRAKRRYGSFVYLG